MKFEAKEFYTVYEDLSYTSYTGRGIGKIQVKYNVAPNKSNGYYWIQIEGVAVSGYEYPAESIESEAVKMYKAFIQNKISSRHVVVKEKGMYRVYDIQTGASILLTQEAIGKLWSLV